MKEASFFTRLKQRFLKSDANAIYDKDLYDDYNRGVDDETLRWERDKFIKEAMWMAYNHYNYMSKYRSLEDKYNIEKTIYFEKVEEFNKNARKYNERLELREVQQAKLKEFNEQARRAESEVSAAFHDFQQRAALLPNPVIDQNHAFQLFAAVFPSLPVSRHPHLAKYAYFAPLQTRQALSLPSPETPPVVPPLILEAEVKQKPREPLFLENFPKQSPASLETWGHFVNWELVNGTYQPVGDFAANIPTGPTDPKLRRLPIYRDYGGYEMSARMVKYRPYKGPP